MENIKEIEDYKRRLVRCNKYIKKLEREHNGFETSKYTYWAGYDLGYYKGKASILEGLIEDIDN